MKITNIQPITINGIEYYSKHDVAQAIDYAMTCIQCAVGLDDGEIATIEDANQDIAEIVKWINAAYRAP